MKSIREQFVKDFSEEEAVALEMACEAHESDHIEHYRGDDPFKYVIVMCIGFECFEIKSYRNHHGIKTSLTKLKKWIRDHADLGNYSAGIDYLALACGKYQPYIKKTK